jgi:hypothetical protein
MGYRMNNRIDQMNSEEIVSVRWVSRWCKVECEMMKCMKFVGAIRDRHGADESGKRDL